MASPSVRVLLCGLAGALCGTVATLSLAGTPATESPSAVEPSPVVEPAETPRDVLRAWDAARAAAWTSGDPAALARLYTPGSVAGRRDVAMLRAWLDRRVVVSSLTTQVLRLQVLVDEPSRLVLVVTDRVAVVQAASRLPQDRPTTRRLELVRPAGDRWRVASVSPGRPARS